MVIASIEKIVRGALDIITTCKGGAILYKWYVKKTTSRDSYFSGNWHNDGGVSKMNIHYIDLQLSCAKGCVSGYFNVRMPGEEEAWMKLKLSGKRRFSQLRCQIFPIRHGGKFIFGKVVLKKKDLHLQWVTNVNVLDALPHSLILHRTLPVII